MNLWRDVVWRELFFSHTVERRYAIEQALEHRVDDLAPCLARAASGGEPSDVEHVILDVEMTATNGVARVGEIRRSDLAADPGITTCVIDTLLVWKFEAPRDFTYVVRLDVLLSSR